MEVVGVAKSEEVSPHLLESQDHSENHNQEGDDEEDPLHRIAFVVHLIDDALVVPHESGDKEVVFLVTLVEEVEEVSDDSDEADEEVVEDIVDDSEGEGRGLQFKDRYIECGQRHDLAEGVAEAARDQANDRVETIVVHPYSNLVDDAILPILFVVDISLSYSCCASLNSRVH